MSGLYVCLYLYVGLWVGVLAERLGFKMNTVFHKLTAILTWPALQFLMLVVLIFTNE